MRSRTRLRSGGTTSGLVYVGVLQYAFFILFSDRLLTITARRISTRTRRYRKLVVARARALPRSSSVSPTCSGPTAKRSTDLETRSASVHDWHSSVQYIIYNSSRILCSPRLVSLYTVALLLSLSSLLIWASSSGPLRSPDSHQVASWQLTLHTNIQVSSLRHHAYSNSDSADVVVAFVSAASMQFIDHIM